jgi:hypothetical protein
LLAWVKAKGAVAVTYEPRHRWSQRIAHVFCPSIL